MKKLSIGDDVVMYLRMDGGVFVGGKEEVASGVEGVGLGENDMGDGYARCCT